MDNHFWHDRFLTQARWTEALRKFLYKQTGITDQSRILEVGCGTGVITAELCQYSKQRPMGIDIDFQRVQMANNLNANPHFYCADVYHLPFRSASIDFVVAHFLFLWLKEPVCAAKEILRVLKPGGTMIALAEPDYLARIDHPKELWQLGEAQTKALIRQGVNPMMGRQLPEVFSQAGVMDIQYGVTGFQTSPTLIPAWLDSEWNTLSADLKNEVSSEKLVRFREIDMESRQIGTRVLWVPTFYAYGSKG